MKIAKIRFIHEKNYFCIAFMENSSNTIQRALFIAAFLLTMAGCWAQRVTMSGTVRAAESGESLMGAYVMLVDTANTQNRQGCITNHAGFYSVSVPSGTYRLTVSYMSYRSISEILILGKSVMRNFELEQETISGEEVVVTGQKSDHNIASADVGRMELKIETIKAMPALMGEADVIKSVQLLPGVQSGGEGNTGYYVRGGGTDQNLILLDEATVYNAGHLFGFFSIFNADAVKNVELIKSGMPAYFGGRAASILNVYQKEGNLKRYEVDGGVGLIFSHLTVQGPLKKDKASFIISGRRTYADVLVQPFLKPTSPLKGMDFYFYDLNAKFNVIINDKHRLYFGAYYGSDVYGKPMLCELLSKLQEVEGLHWIRTLYTYPERITDELLLLLRDSKKLVKYLDIPIQHCEDGILKRMNRRSTKAELLSLITHIRETVPGITLRTTLIVGFPGESEEDFCRLHEFVKQMRFDRLGCFTYSPEEETLAAEYPDQIEEQTKQDRLELIMQSQADISLKNNESKLGKTCEVLIEGYDDYIKCYYGRTAADAPEIDGRVFFTSKEKLLEGEFVRVKITDSLDYDPVGEAVR